MKKWLAGLSIGSMLFLGGCSFLQEANNTLTYVNEAVSYVDGATAFAEEVPALIEQAVTDPASAKELEAKLEEMKQEIAAFGDLQVPDIAADLHQQVVEQNEKAQAAIDMYLNNIEGGKLDPAILQNTELAESLEQIASIIDQIQKLAQ